MAEGGATLAEMQQALQDLINAEGFEIPGLDKESILDNYIEVKHKENLEVFADDREKRQEEKNG